MRPTSSAFSLLEIMIVITIIGVLAMVAIPNYKRYTGRTRMVDLLKIAEKYKANAIYVYDVNSSFPQDGTRILPGATLVDTEYVLTSDFGNGVDRVSYRRIDADNAYLKITFSQSVSPSTYQGISLYYAMRYNNGKLEFACGDWTNGFQSSLIRDELPVSCRDEVGTFLGAI